MKSLHTTAQRPREMVLLFLDETGYYRWLDEPRVWWATAPSNPAVTKQGGSNNTRWRIIGALNALSGQVNYQDNYIVGRKQVIKIYQHIADIYADVRRIWMS